MSAAAAAAAAASTAKKIPFRSRKVRISSSEPPSTDTSKKPRHVLPILPRSLSAPGELDSALGHLRAVDPTIANLINSHDPPAFDNSATPFLSLSRTILYQQLAKKAAASIYARFLSLCGGEESVLPEIVSALTPQQLREIGVSARKASYLHDLSSKYLSGVLTDPAIVAMDDESLLSLLTLVKGIGPWSVHMFLIFSLHRPDVLPVGDLGVRKGVQMLHGLKKVPEPLEMEELCEPWRPYRSAGAWYMWRLVESKGKPS